MADTLALGASAARHGGSSPLPRTVFGFDIKLQRSSPLLTEAVHLIAETAQGLTMYPIHCNPRTVFGFR